MNIKSWEKQTLDHVNNICDINVNGNWYQDVLILNIDLDRRNIVGRIDNGDGQFVTFFNVENLIIMDKFVRRPGKRDIPECLP
jgi:hypothetical protein